MSAASLAAVPALSAPAATTLTEAITNSIDAGRSLYSAAEAQIPTDAVFGRAADAAHVFLGSVGTLATVQQQVASFAQASGDTISQVLAGFPPPELAEPLATIRVIGSQAEGLNASAEAAVRAIESARAQLDSASGALQQESEALQARVAALGPQIQQVKDAVASNKNQSLWTWLCPLAKAVDETVSAIETGESTEQRWRDANAQLQSYAQQAASIGDVVGQLGTLSASCGSVSARAQAIANNVGEVASSLSQITSSGESATPEILQLMLVTAQRNMSDLAAEAQ